MDDKIFDSELDLNCDAMLNDNSDNSGAWYGIKYRSGRYEYGSGENPYQHDPGFLGRVRKMRSENYTYTDQETGKTYTGYTAIAKYMKMSTKELHNQMAAAKAGEWELLIADASKYRDQGMSFRKIGEKMDIPEATVRSLLTRNAKERQEAAKATYNVIKEAVDKAEFLDVGKDVEKDLGNSIGTTRYKFDEALTMLQNQGYERRNIRVPQPTNPGQYTPMTILTKPGVPYKDIYKAAESGKIKSLVDYNIHSDDGGRTFTTGYKYPASLDSKRLKIRYSEEGGLERDGLIEIRRGVPDLNLGENKLYSQVRILVDNDKYMKGMAVYADDLPKGIDIRFNTNKKKGTKLEDVLKPIKTEDPDDPFGSLIKSGTGQSEYTDPKTGERKLSLINKRADEGDWDDWSRTTPSQFAAKQTKKLVKNLMKETLSNQEEELKDIMAVTNNTVKRQMLLDYADARDASAVHLKLAPFPDQSYQVILPDPYLKDTEIYAPNYKQNEKVAVVRFPFAGAFESPILTVNNKEPYAEKTIGKNPTDAVMINKNVANRMSGADYDGDTVMVIPLRNGLHIKTEDQPQILKDVDIDTQFAGHEGMKVMNKVYQQKQMGEVSNLIMDMTLKGAPTEEIGKAVVHSMVVIDAVKHKLDWKLSEKVNDIAALKKRYQGHYNDNGKFVTGASTLITRAKSPISVDKPRGSKIINEDGTVTQKTAFPYVSRKTGELTVPQVRVPTMYATKDAHSISTGTEMEELYADYANKQKELAQSARKLYIDTPLMVYKPSAAKDVYKKERDSILNKLYQAQKSSPRERQAILLANSRINAKIEEAPELKEPQNKADLKKLKNRELNKARNELGSHRPKIELTPLELKAIESGAITDSQFQQVIRYLDPDFLKATYMPRNNAKALPDAKKARITSLSNSGYTTSQIASMLNVSVSTVNSIIHPDEKH